MDGDLYKNSMEYEKLTQSVYQSILHNEGTRAIKVQHDVSLEGRSGVAHQIDVHWRFTQANIEHTVLVECKNYSTALTLEKVRNFHAVLMDIGNCKGVMVTKVGFQGGVVQYAKFYDIDLKLLRKPTEKDWEGKIKDIRLHLVAKSPVSTSEKPLCIEMFLAPENVEQEAIIKELKSKNALIIPSGPQMCLLDQDGIPATEEMRCWLPKQLNVLELEPGGPYQQNIELKNKYILINPSTPKERLIKAIGMRVTYWVECLDAKELVFHGAEIVESVLKDFLSGNAEYVQRKTDN